MHFLLTIIFPVAFLSGEAAAGSQAYMTIRRQLDRSNDRDRQRNLRSQEASTLVVEVELNEAQFKELSSKCVNRENGITDDELGEKLANYKEFGLSEHMSKFEKLAKYDYEWSQLCQLIWERLSDANAGGELVADFDQFNKRMNTMRWKDAVPRFLTDLFTPPKALYH